MLFADTRFEFRRVKTTRNRRPARVNTDFEDAEHAALSVVRRKRRDGSYLVYVKHTPAGSSTRRGMYNVLPTEREAVAKFDEIVAEANEAGWRLVASADTPTWMAHKTEVGTVRLCEDCTEMILEVSSGSYFKYLIRGRILPDGRYSGHHVGLPGDRVVMASWRSVPETNQHYQGMWHEPQGRPGEQVLQFTFQLPTL